MTDALICWKCGTPLGDLVFPLERTAECAACRADLHACRMCEHYDPRAAQSCREVVADEVLDKERANFCGYFETRANAYTGHGGTTDAAWEQLNALFGGNAHGAGEQIYEAGSRSEAEIAKEQLEHLFGSGKKGDL